MRSRWLISILTLVLAAPVCCCGFTALQSSEAGEQEFIGCPMCAAQDPAGEEPVPANGHDCPCKKDTIVRDVAPEKPALPHAKRVPLPWTEILPLPTGARFSGSPGAVLALSHTPPPRWCGVALHLLQRRLLL